MPQSSGADAIGAQLVQQLQGVDGVVALALGGSRARGNHTPISDIDLGIYYDPTHPLDIGALGQIATALDDQERRDLVTPVGGWGPWINGGGWLKVGGLPVDFLYRDLAQVSATVEACRAGQVSIHYQPGHPHGFVTSIYLAEIAHCRPLWDPHGLLAKLKIKTHPYPPQLKQATLDKFLWEATFSISVARKSLARADVAYVAGSAFRAVACLMQTLFALNEQYLLNEKGAVALAASFPFCPPNLQGEIAAIFAALQANPAALAAALNRLEALTQAVIALVATNQPMAASVGG